MNSLKPSKINGIRAVIGGIFGIILIFIPSMGATLFGIALVILAIFIAVWNFKNATGGSEEPDPLNQKPENTYMPYHQYQKNAASRFCPYCGAKAQGDFEFCNVCGKKLP